MSVKQSDDKSWYSRVSYKSNGKYKTKSKFGFKTKKEALLWEQAIKVKLEDGETATAESSFADYFLKWYEVYKKNKVSLSTQSNYRATHHKIESHFGTKRLNQISKIDYQKFLNEYGKTLSVGTMKKTNKQIRSCIQDAVHHGDIKKDFTYKVELTGTESKSESSKFLSQKEAKLLIESLTDEHKDMSLTRRMATLALATGMRYSEIAGLTYNRLNFKDNTILIDRTWDARSNKFKPTKTNNSRVIKVENSLMQELQEFTVNQKKLQLSTYMINPEKLVFAKYDGIPPTNDSANKSLRKACKRAGIKEITFHSLRHTHVSILLYNGMDLSSIAKRVGHRSTTTTADTYAHIIEELQNKSDKLSDNAMKELFS